MKREFCKLGKKREERLRGYGTRWWYTWGMKIYYNSNRNNRHVIIILKSFIQRYI